MNVLFFSFFCCLLVVGMVWDDTALLYSSLLVTVWLPLAGERGGEGTLSVFSVVVLLLFLSLYRDGLT